MMRLGFSDQIADDPHEAEVLRLMKLLKRQLEPHAHTFLSRQQRLGTDASVASNALIATLQLMLAKQIALHSVLSEHDDPECDKLFALVVSSTRHNFDQALETYRAGAAQLQAQGATRQ